jgi:hypothetical protein
MVDSIRSVAFGTAMRRVALRSAVLLWLAVPGCREQTGRLGPERESRFAAESILHRADDLTFRYTEGGGRRGGRWEDRVASIVVTRQTVFIHKNEKVGLELTPRTRREVEVRRDRERIRITAGSGRSAESWSFVPPTDPDTWARDIRAAARGDRSH